MSVPEPEFAEVFRTEDRGELSTMVDELRRRGFPVRAEYEVEPGSGNFELLSAEQDPSGRLLRIQVAREFAGMALTALGRQEQSPFAAPTPSLAPTTEPKTFSLGILGAIGLSVILAVLVVLANVVFVVALIVAGLGMGGIMTYALQATAVINLVCFSVVAILGVVLIRSPVREVFPFTRFRWTTLLGLAVATEGIMILTSEMDNVLQCFLPMPDWLRDEMVGILQGGWASFVTLVIVAPITEEIFFRGLILRGLLKRYSAVTAVVWSSILFALIHMNPYQIGGAFVVGLFLGWLMVRTGSLWPCLLTHALFNLHVLVLPVLSERFDFRVPGFTMPVEEMGTQMQPLWFDGLGLALTVVGLLMLLVITRKPPTVVTDDVLAAC